MGMDLFPSADKIVSAIEGNGAPVDDLGGQTKWGIARTRHPEITDDQWAAFTEADAVALRRHQYWDAHRLGELPWPWALALYDGAINQGGIAIGLAQASLGVPVDNAVGDRTIGAVLHASAEELHVFLALRLVRYAKTQNASEDEKGWFKRVVIVAMAAAVPPDRGAADG